MGEETYLHTFLQMSLQKDFGRRKDKAKAGVELLNLEY